MTISDYDHRKCSGIVANYAVGELERCERFVRTGACYPSPEYLEDIESRFICKSCNLTSGPAWQTSLYEYVIQMSRSRVDLLMLICSQAAAQSPGTALSRGQISPFSLSDRPMLVVAAPISRAPSSKVDAVLKRQTCHLSLHIA